MPASPRIAVLLPCHNEAAAIGRVISDFRRALPAAAIYVFDNNSNDRTVDVATAAGAIVRHESRQGKGHVVRRMFSDVEADLYLLADGDGTYDAASAPKMIAKLCAEYLDMVVGCRVQAGAHAYRRGHRFGNALLTGAVARLFGRQFTDILSGYRVLSRRFVHSFPALSTGFEIETEMTVHALELRMPIGEVDTPYAARIEGTVSKLKTVTDGLKIGRLIAALYRREYPARFFGAIGAALIMAALALAEPIILTFTRTGLVPRFPTAVLCVGLFLMASLSLTCGLVLDTVTHGRREVKRLAYLAAARASPRFAGRGHVVQLYPAAAAELSPSGPMFAVTSGVAASQVKTAD
jgi:hypothetical protein